MGQICLIFSTQVVNILCASLLSHWELLHTHCLYDDMQPLISDEVIQDLWFWNEAQPIP